MSLMHDIIKIKYTRLGYLPNYPYHLISDEEMFNAFINLEITDDSSGSSDSVERFFDDYYPNPFEDVNMIYLGSAGEEISLRGEYLRLKNYIVEIINEYLSHRGAVDEDEYEIPDWIYSYMLGEVIYNVPGTADDFQYKDIHDTLLSLDNIQVDISRVIDEAGEEDLIQLLNDDHINNEFNRVSCLRCYIESTKYISTLTTGIRPPTVFGEPHVIKQLRMEN